MAKAVLDSQTPFPDTGPQAIPWCICGKCRDMHNTIENVCCRSRPSITTSASFDTIVLDMHVLAVCIVSRSEDFAEEARYTPESYRKAAYRQFVMWQHGYLGRSNRKVLPSCVVWSVRDHYPAPDNRYPGFKEY